MSYEINQLRSMVDSYLRRGYPSVYVDRDGDFVVDHGHIRVFATLVEWEQGVSMVKLWSLVASNVPFSDSLTQYLNELNRNYTFGTFYWAHGMVYVHFTLLAGGLDPNELLWAVKILADITGDVDTDVQDRFGGVHFDYSASSRAYYKPWTAEEYQTTRGPGLGTVLVAGAVGLAAGAAIGYAMSGGSGYGDYGDYGDGGVSVGGIVGGEMRQAERELDLAEREMDLEERERELAESDDDYEDFGDDEEDEELDDEDEEYEDDSDDEDEEYEDDSDDSDDDYEGDDDDGGGDDYDDDDSGDSGGGGGDDDDESW